MQSLIRWSAWLCLSLMLWTAALESVHVHPNQTEATSCSICVAAHSTSPTVVSTHLAPTFHAIGHLQDKDVLVKARFETACLGIRGPPVLQGFSS